MIGENLARKPPEQVHRRRGRVNVYTSEQALSWP